MHIRVTSTLCPTPPARLGTGIQHGFQKRFITSRPPGRYRTRCRANIRAVEIESNTLSELLYGIFPKTSVGTSNTGLGAVVAGLNAPNQFVVGVAANMGMRTNHFLSVHVGCLNTIVIAPDAARTAPCAGLATSVA